MMTSGNDFSAAGPQSRAHGLTGMLRVRPSRDHPCHRWCQSLVPARLADTRTSTVRGAVNRFGGSPYPSRSRNVDLVRDGCRGQRPHPDNGPPKSASSGGIWAVWSMGFELIIWADTEPQTTGLAEQRQRNRVVFARGPWVSPPMDGSYWDLRDRGARLPCLSVASSARACPKACPVVLARSFSGPQGRATVRVTHVRVTRQNRSGFPRFGHNLSISACITRGKTSVASCRAAGHEKQRKEAQCAQFLAPCDRRSGLAGLPYYDGRKAQFDGYQQQLGPSEMHADRSVPDGRGFCSQENIEFGDFLKTEDFARGEIGQPNAIPPSSFARRFRIFSRE